MSDQIKSQSPLVKVIVHQYGNVSAIAVDISEASNVSLSVPIVFIIPPSSIQYHWNVGVPAPMAVFPFCGWKDSFFGTLHSNGEDAVRFYTEGRIIVSRWF